MVEIEISDESYKYLQSLAVPLQDTTATILDRVTKEHKELLENRLTGIDVNAKPAFDLKFDTSNLPNVSFTTIASAKINNTPVKKRYWNDILEEMLVTAVQLGNDTESIKSYLAAQTLSGQHSDNGYRFVPECGFSFQGVDAGRACKNIAILSIKFKISVSITMNWRSNSKAQYPGQTGVLTLP